MSTSEQKAQDGLVTAAWWGSRRAEGVVGEGMRLQTEEGERK